MTADPIMGIVLFDPLAVITIKVDGDTIQVLLINLCFPGDTLHWPLVRCAHFVTTMASSSFVILFDLMATLSVVM
jgi:hypothetical protein